jgi:hypothetical protein
MFYNKDDKISKRAVFMKSLIIVASSARSRFERMRPKQTEHSGGTFFRFSFFGVKEREHAAAAVSGCS